MKTADLLTHALVAFSLGTLLSWKFKKIGPSLITMMMVGSVLPDLTRIGLILDSTMIENVLGIPFSWHPLHALGGVLISTTIFTQLFEEDKAKMIFLLTGTGAASHLVLDAFLLKASGRSYTMFFPVTTYNPSIPGFYLSTDLLPALIAGIIALTIWKIDPNQITGSKEN